ncbi:MAG: hypothetical protein IJY05_05100, partial [Clostridia bacterium]|nr:hypothetical protein [Clostridia bacterium]
MRTKTMKNVLLWIAGIFLLISLAGLFLVQSMKKKNALAAADWQTGVFEMNDGVSLKLNEEKNGLRFIVKMDKNVANFVKETAEAEMGFVIAPKSFMLAANGDYINMSKKVGGAVDKAKIYKEGEFYQANACITNVMLENFELDFVAVGYIKYNGEIRYTEYNDYARHNMYDLVNMAFLNGCSEDLATFKYLQQPTEDGKTEGWYGSEQFPIVVENADEYKAVVEVANDSNINLANNVVVIKNNATTNESFTDETPIILSAALDEVNKSIVALPDSIKMPDGIGMIARIRDTEKKYNALSETDKSKVENYAKVENLLEAIEGYDRVYKNDATDGTVIPSYVPNYTSTIGGSATTRTDDVYGNVLTVKSDSNGRAALSFTNFPSVTKKYATIYFYVKVSVGCDIYLSDGITNDGWGETGKNTWSVTGLWCNADKWRLVEVNVEDGYIGTNFAIGFRPDTTGFTFEISDFYGIDKAVQAIADLGFGKMTNSGETNENGKVYNLTTQWGNSDTDFQSFDVNAMSNALENGY